MQALAGTNDGGLISRHAAGEFSKTLSLRHVATTPPAPSTRSASTVDDGAAVFLDLEDLPFAAVHSNVAFGVLSPTSPDCPNAQQRARAETASACSAAAIPRVAMTSVLRSTWFEDPRGSGSAVGSADLVDRSWQAHGLLRCWRLRRPHGLRRAQELRCFGGPMGYGDRTGCGDWSPATQAAPWAAATPVDLRLHALRSARRRGPLGHVVARSGQSTWDRGVLFDVAADLSASARGRAAGPCAVGRRPIDPIGPVGVVGRHGSYG